MSSRGPQRKLLREVVKMGVRELCQEASLQKKKRKWVRSRISRREQLGASSRLLKELAEEDPASYRNILRLSALKFQELLELVTPIIRKQDTTFREAISCKTKLEITLRYLATGDSFKSLMYLFRVPHNTISSFLPDVLSAIYKVLEEYIKVPVTTEAWREIEKGFETKWNFPKCCGALDGKHIEIQRPANSTSLFYNYKGTYSIVLFAMVDADYCFRYIDVGSDGRASDSTIFRTSTLKIAIEKNLLNWPDGAVCVGDDAFPLEANLLKPYKCRGLSVQQRIFNYRLSRARRVVENAFGILASRFRIFSRAIPLNLDTTEVLVKSACALHNWLRMTSSTTYFSPGCVDEEDLIAGQIINGTWRNSATLMRPVERLFSSNSYKKDGEVVRKLYAEHFMTDWSVPWQMKFVELHINISDDQQDNSDFEESQTF